LHALLAHALRELELGELLLSEAGGGAVRPPKSLHAFSVAWNAGPVRGWQGVRDEC
jgi:hypothetical protein